MLISERPRRDAHDLFTRISGDVVGPADTAWDQARQAWNLAVDQRPALVAFPENADDVVAIVDYARRHGLRVAPQGTGHNAGPLGSLENTVLLSTSRMRGVVIDAGRAPRPRRRRHAVARGHRARVRARPRPAGGLVARRRRRRLLPRRRRQLARAQARPGRQQRARDRDRDRRRPPAPRRRRPRPGPLLGAARRRRQLRRRDRDGDRAVPGPAALRGRDVLAVGARVRGDARLARVDADRPGRGHLVRPDPAAAADPGRAGDAARPRAGDDRRRHPRQPRVRRRDRAGAARPRAGDRHVRHGRAGRALAAAQRPREPGAGADRAPAPERRCRPRRSTRSSQPPARTPARRC